MLPPHVRIRARPSHTPEKLFEEDDTGVGELGDDSWEQAVTASPAHRKAIRTTPFMRES